MLCDIYRHTISDNYDRTRKEKISVATKRNILILLASPAAGLHDHTMYTVGCLTLLVSYRFPAISMFWLRFVLCSIDAISFLSVDLINQVN